MLDTSQIGVDQGSFRQPLPQRDHRVCVEHRSWVLQPPGRLLGRAGTSSCLRSVWLFFRGFPNPRTKVNPFIPRVLSGN